MNRIYTAHKKGYRIRRKGNNYKVIEIDIKYRSKRVIELPYSNIGFIEPANDHLVLYQNTAVYVFGKDQITLNDIHFMAIGVAWLIGQYLHVSLKCNDSKLLIYNNEKEIIKQVLIIFILGFHQMVALCVGASVPLIFFTR